MAIGHVGHLVQIPKAEADAAASFEPDYWTVFNAEKASEAAARSEEARTEPGLCWRASRPRATASIAATRAASRPPMSLAVADRLDELDGATLRRHHHLSGPPLRSGDAKNRPDAEPCDAPQRRRDIGAQRAGGRSRSTRPGRPRLRCSAALADAGATQVEPGHGLTGTTPLHAVEDLPELPAVVYVTEVSHLHGGEAYCFGGGLYIDPVFPDYEVKAIVSREPTAASAALRNVEIPPPAAIDYYGMIDTSSGPADASATQSSSASAHRLSSPAPTPSACRALPPARLSVGAIHDALGRPADWPV